MESTPRDERRALLGATIDACRRRLMLGALAYRLLHLVAAAILFPLAVVIADHLLAGGLPHAVIFGAGIVWGLATALAAMGVSVRTVVRRLNALFVARHLERSRGIAHNPLVNMVLLQESPQAPYARHGAVRQAASVLATSGAESAGGSAALRQPGLLLLAAVGIWVVYALITPKPILPSLARLFGADRPAPTATRLELVRPRADEAVYAGEPLDIEFAVSGRPVAQVWFELLDPADHDAAPLLRSAVQRSPDSEASDRRWVSLAAHEIPGDLHYRCSAGDAVVQGVIPVQPRPDLLELQIDLVPPAYVAEPARRTTDPDLDIWAGTRATFVALANTDVLDPIFVLRGRTETRTRMSVDPAESRRARLSLRLVESGEYWIEFSDRGGRPCCDPPTHRLTVRPDSAPRIEIIAPSREAAPDDVVDVTHVAWLRAVASDDVRLEAAFLVRETDGRVDRRNLLDSEALARGRSIEVGVATSDLPLEIGESRRVWFEARDNRAALDGTPAPQTSRTRVLTLIRTPEVAPEQTVPSGPQAGDEADAADLENSTAVTEQVVKRRGARAGEGGEPADGGGQIDDGQGGPDRQGDKYRRASEGGTNDETAEDVDERPEILDPQAVDVVDAGGGDDATRENVADDGESGGRSAAAREFDEELRRFDKQHGDEAREVNQRIGSRPDDGGADGPQPRQSGAGGGREDDSSERASQRGSQAAPELSEEAEPQAADDREEEREEEAEKAPPQSQSSEADQGQGDQPDQDKKPRQASDDGQPDQQEPEEQRGDDGEGKPPEKPQQPKAKPAPKEGEAREAGEPEEQKGEPGPEQGDADTQDQKPTERDGQAEEQGAAKPEEEPVQESATDGGQRGEPQQPAGGTQPGAEDDERVIPLSGERRPPAVEPPPEPQTPGDGAEAEPPADSGQRADVTDTLELLRRVEDISEDDLAELGWPLEKKRAFVRDFERLREAARRAGALSQLQWWRARVELGTGDVQVGAGLSEDMSRGVAGGSSAHDGLEQIAPPREQHVPPELQALLDAYYRSLAEKRAR